MDSQQQARMSDTPLSDFFFPDSTKYSDLIAHPERDASSQEPEPTDPYSPLLDLPGEIRNLIYEYLLESDCVTLYKAKLAKASNIGKDQFKESGSGRSLTHTCSQLRAEFLQLFQESTTIHMSSSNIGGYVNAHYPDPANAIGRLVVEVTLTPSPTDLGSVIHLPALAPRMDVTLVYHGDTKRWFHHSLKILAGVGNNPVWRNVVLQDMPRLLVFIEKEEPHLVIELKLDTTRRWTTPMGFPSTKRRYLVSKKADPEQTRVWRSKVGLGGLRFPHGQIILCQRGKE
ncbi:hypothetical protein FB567DRAFT_587964 [Paraphoma chrysanthemicola]|uniref:F-box domain-containing protein n=1 Tax=Paraphoma chrysanthemicola TaxID=798071 RepID=A0A8K0RDF4_9PLEO|nr:hypothetical protein FB567DRAFT_587964 [Paraphoma chrysanthemicola]